jgi:hypothetical protein
MIANATSPSAAQTRRELTRRYKEAPPPMGVYAIRNLVNGRLLVGASLNAGGALNRHRFELTMKHHRNTQLQQDWLHGGADSFSFEIVDRVKPRDDPAFDYRAELDSMLELWREELGAIGERSYTR